ncbi:MAG TPA: hypothetical protein VHY08_15870 [Bacillota bacterium]|nr:hypothetical protein [Bacillota bacterium]
MKTFNPNSHPGEIFILGYRGRSGVVDYLDLVNNDSNPDLIWLALK